MAGVIGIVIVAHGGLAREYLAAVEHIVGRQSGMRAISIEDGHDRARKQAEICAAADAVDTGAGVVVVTDMFGGSPSNLSLRACIAPNRRILYGANLPMLIKLAKSRGRGVDVAVASALESGRKYIDSLDLAPPAEGFAKGQDDAAATETEPAPAAAAGRTCA
jgi:PTS system mannose-specific IIA component